MALNASLNKFKQQQERCQTTLANIAAAHASTARSQIAPRAQPSVPAKLPQPMRFSNDTQRLQHITSVRKSAVGAQIKLVIELLYERRQALTAEQINEQTYVAIHTNKAVFDSLTNNPKVHFDGKHFSYKSTHDLKGKDQLLSLIRSAKYIEGLPVSEIKDAYPSVMEDLQALKASGDIWWLSSVDSKEDMVYPNDPRSKIVVDADIKKLFRETELPRDMIDIEKELRKYGEKPATNTVKRREAALINGQPAKPKSKKKERRITKRTKLTNAHMPELFGDMLK